MNPSSWSWSWSRQHKWRLLLIGIVLLLMISPISEIYDRSDNVITPLTSIIFLAVIFGTAETRLAAGLLTTLTAVWLVISIATEGSGLFAGASLVAPVLFMGLLVVIFSLLSRWLIRAVHIDTEVICAAICGYLTLGILWMCFYALAARMLAIVHPNDPSPFVYSLSPKITFRDLLYFSYTTLSTTGYGDIVPRDPLIRMLAVMEAIVGVFYNTIVIARFVGLYGMRPRDAGPSSI